jgi:hypothetical protein
MMDILTVKAGSLEVTYLEAGPSYVSCVLSL